MANPQYTYNPDMSKASIEPNPHIRPIAAQDLDAIKRVIDLNNLFPSEMLDEMTSPYFNGNEEEFWITFTRENTPVAIAYYAPERMTNGTYNIYLMAVHPGYQGKSIGRKLLVYIENHLKSRGERIILIETSGLAEFDSAKRFYSKNGYHQEAIIREFYDKGDDKIIFRKALQNT